MFKSLKVKSIIFVLGAFLATSIPTLYYILNETNQASYALAKRSVITNSLYNSKEIKAIINKEIALAQKMADSDSIKQWLTHENNQEIKNVAMKEIESFKKLFKDKNYFIAIKSSGNYYFNDEQGKYSGKEFIDTLTPNDPKSEWFYATLNSNKQFLVNIDFDESLDVTNIWINMIVYYNDEAIAVIGTGLNLSKFTEYILTELDNHVTSFFIDATGNITAHKNADLISYRNITTQNKDKKSIYSFIKTNEGKDKFKLALDNIVYNTANTLDMNLNIFGGEKILAISKVSEIGWYNVSFIDNEDFIFYDLLNSKISIFIVFLSFVIFAGVILLFINQNILVPLFKIDRSIKKIENGDYDIQTKVDNQDEIGRVAKNLEKMSMTVANYISVLEAQKLELIKSNEIKENFLSSVSHELKTPLNAILGFTDIMLMNGAGTLKEEDKEFLSIINENAKCLANIVEDMLDIAKLDRSKMIMELSNINIKEFAHRVYSRYHSQAKVKNLDVVLNLDESLEIVNSDEKKLERVLKNLFSNAIKFSTKGTIEFDILDKDKNIEIIVKDQGIGIDLTDIDCIFEKFRQIDGGITRKYGGAGLGLSIAKELVEFLNGKIEVNSEVGKGSEFKITLPKVYTQKTDISIA